MMELLVFKERLKALYVRFGTFAGPALKFAVAFASITMLNISMGFMEKLDSPLTALLLAAVCTVLPYGGMALIAGAVMLMHIYALSMELAVITAALLLVVVLLYYGFQPGDSCLLVITPLLFMLKVPYVVPLVVGLAGSVLSVVPVSCGVFIYYIIMYVKQNSGMFAAEGSASEVTQKYAQIIKSILFNQTMLVVMAAFALCILIVYVIRNLSIDYAWSVAIAAGTVAQLVVFLMGDFMFNVSVDILSLVFGMLAGVILAAAYNFFAMALDYSRTEHVQFEDDDYYYYVKAVPKITVTAPDVKVKHINARRSSRRQ